MSDRSPVRTVHIQDAQGSVLLEYADRVGVDGIEVAVTGIFRWQSGRVIVTFEEVPPSTS